MDELFTFFIAVIMLGAGVCAGYLFGKDNERSLRIECEKELPRNVSCKIIAVPVDKN